MKHTWINADHRLPQPRRDREAPRDGWFWFGAVVPFLLAFVIGTVIRFVFAR